MANKANHADNTQNTVPRNLEQKLKKIIPKFIVSKETFSVFEHQRGNLLKIAGGVLRKTIQTLRQPHTMQ